MQSWVLFAWVFFRSNDFFDAIGIIKGLFGFSNGTESLPFMCIPVIILPLLVDALLGRMNIRCLAVRFHPIQVGSGVYAFFIGVLAAVFLWLKPLSSVPFIYFQF